LIGEGETGLLRLALLLLTVGLLAAGALAFRQWRARRRAEAVGAEAEARANSADTALVAAPGSYWAWPAGSDDTAVGRAGVGLHTVLGLPPESLSTFDDVLDALARGDALQLSVDTASLRRSGIGVSFAATSADGHRSLEFRGARARRDQEDSGADTVWVRDVSAAAAESKRLMEQVTEMTAQSAGLRNVFDGLDLPIWVRGPEFTPVYCNRAFARAVDEQDPASAIAAAREIAGGPTGWGQALAHEAQHSGDAVTRSLHVVIGGERRYLDITEFPIAGSGAWRVVGFAVDRTDADEARDELARHMVAHAEVLEKLGTGISVYGADTRLQFFNTAFAHMWGLEPEWLATVPTEGEVLEELRTRRFFPEQPDFQDFKRKRLELFTSLIEPQEELLHLPDERVFRMVVSPHPQGGLLFTFEDVTDRLALEQSYNTLIAVQSETLDNLHQAVAVFGPDGRLKLFNPAYARIWGLDSVMLRGEPRVAEIIDAVRHLFIPRDEWESLRSKLLAGVSDRTARAGRFERGDGTTLDYAAVPLPDGAMLFSYIDVTDSVSVQRALNERNQALLAADQLKTEFVTNVSYELRTPLNTIIGFTEILSNQYFGTLNHRQAEYAGGVLDASQQLLALIDNILDLALVESGRLSLELGTVKIHSMLESVVALAREAASKSRVAINLDCAEDAGIITGDERRLKQALFNVISNAIKYSSPGEAIELSAERVAGGVRLSVVDHGPGIPADDQERIFERFERGHGGDQRPQGVGLGLALVRSYIELHGGTVALRSQPGEGTGIYITVPETPPGAAGLEAEIRGADEGGPPDLTGESSGI
jgi:signal transduction histidine kinase